MNTRYLGGAFRRGSVSEIVSEATGKGVGIVQIECPEQRAWGGILKKYMWLAFDAKNSPVYRFRRLLLPVYTLHTRLVYRRIAASLVKDIRDYQKSGFTVKGIAGVDGSPTCGVDITLDVNASFEFFAANNTESLNRDTFNSRLYDTCAVKGSGMFIEELKKLLLKKRLSIPIYAHNLISEMHGESCGTLID
jgi:predicted secreted protein